MVCRLRLATKCFAAFFLAGLALVAGAQTPPAAPAALTKDQKESVLKELEVIVTTKALVPGIDFAKCPSSSPSSEKPSTRLKKLRHSSVQSIEPCATSA